MNNNNSTTDVSVIKNTLLHNLSNLFIDPNKSVEIVSKGFIALTGLCYLSGIVVVNIYLSYYGIYFFNLFKIEYITAGVWAFIPPTILMIFCLMIYTSGKTLYNNIITPLINKNRPRWDSFLPLITIATTIFIFALYLYSLYKSSVHSLLHDIRLDKYDLLMLASYSVCTFIMINLFIRSKSGYSAIFTLCMTIILSSSWILYFSEFVYNKIPKYLGGGSLTEAMITLEINSAVANALKYADIKFIEVDNIDDALYNNNNNFSADKLMLTTNKTHIILETDKEYYVTNNSLIVSLPKECIKAITYKNKFIGFSPNHGAGDTF
jgi:hypothetical protein